jgi:hypothetical protein
VHELATGDRLFGLWIAQELHLALAGQVADSSMREREALAKTVCNHKRAGLPLTADPGETLVEILLGQLIESRIVIRMQRK